MLVPRMAAAKGLGKHYASRGPEFNYYYCAFQYRRKQIDGHDS